MRTASGENGAWNVSAAGTLDEAIPFLNGTKNVILGLPVNAILAQRLRLPTLEASEFNEMVLLPEDKEPVAQPG